MIEEYIITVDKRRDFDGGYPLLKKTALVRCKDCKWYDADGEEMNTQGHCWYKNGEPVMQNMKPDDFCSYGKRKESGDD